MVNIFLPHWVERSIAVLEYSEALSIFWKLKAVDAFMSSCNSTDGEINCIVDRLIDNDEIKNILIKDNHHQLPYHISNQKICKIGYGADHRMNYGI